MKIKYTILKSVFLIILNITGLISANAQIPNIKENKDKTTADTQEINRDNNNIIHISEQGDYINIERNGELVMINKLKYIDQLSSNFDVKIDSNGRDVIVVETKIILDEVSVDEERRLTANGFKSSNNIPEFEYVKLYPNPSASHLNIQFKIVEIGDITIKVFNMLGREVYYEMLNDFNGKYKSNIDLKANGLGTYVIQIIQNDRVITRKIVIE